MPRTKSLITLLCFLSFAHSFLQGQQPSASTGPGLQTVQPPVPFLNPESSDPQYSDPQFADPQHPQPLPERFDVLSIQDSPLHPAPALLGERSVLPGFTRELWRLQWRAGDPIDVYVIRPAGIAKPPVTLFLYGFPSDTPRFRDDSWCSAVTGSGVAAVGFVSALTGQRYHDRPWKQWFVSNLQESLGATVHDVQMILNYLETRDDLDLNRIGIFGQGSGGTIALLAASTDPRLRAIDVLDPWGDWKDWLSESTLIPEDQRPDYLKAAFLDSLAKLDPLHALPALADRALRLQIATFDDITPASAKASLRAAMPAHATFVEYTSVDDYAERAAHQGRILNWLTAQLKAPASSQRASEFVTPENPVTPGSLHP